VGKGKTKLVSISFAAVRALFGSITLYKNTASYAGYYARLNLDLISSPSGFPLPSLRLQSESVPP